MTPGEIKAIFDTFGAGGGFLVLIGFVVVGVLVPLARREIKDKKPPADLISDRELLVFMAKQGEKNDTFERRISSLEDRCEE